MSIIQEHYREYTTLDTGDLTRNQKKQLYTLLEAMRSTDIQTIDEHKQFLELIQILRQASMDDMALFGKMFLQTLKSLLSVGEDGVYTNQLRFLYELIQNVDDCDYEDLSNCNLDIQFRYENEPGRIVLTYNEIGFRPENVFAITGIAEKSKNISANKVEIGEKGIGFKSVFGIAKKVLIESGLFSFELNADNFTVPIPRYEGYEPVKGTRLTLEMPKAKCEGIYNSLVMQYMTQEAMLNQNPIMFLNKLTHLRLCSGCSRYIEFNVQRTVPEQHGELLLERDVTISVDMKDDINGRDSAVKNKISCFRYTMPIVYGRKECEARYGHDTTFSERKHKLIAVFPVISDEMQNYQGVLYSFLPTQVRTTSPIILHVPYKLGGSREYVDSNNNDAWFVFTTQKLVAFLENVYLDLAQILKQDVIQYIPCRHDFFFRGDRGKVGCIMTPELKGDYICSKKVFYTEDGTFETVKDIVAFGQDEKLEDPVLVHKLLQDQKKLFIPPYPVDMKWYGAQVIDNVQEKLFNHGLKCAESFEEILNWLEKNVPDLSYYRLLYANEPVKFNITHLSAVARHGMLWNASIQSARKQIAEKKDCPLCTLIGDIPRINTGAKALLTEVITDADLDDAFMKYLEDIRYQFYAIENKKDFVIAAKNGVVLAKGSELGSFAKLARLFDQNGTFTASIEIRQASEKLNQVDETMSNREYLSLLHGVRKSLMDAFGKRMYDSYIKIIAEAGTDKKRFLSELLQNADDCKYPDGSTPSFKLKMNGADLRVSYNECGFTKDNVRAITAIGESTKKLLLSCDSRSIGEKGVGFKSVFGVAESVDIHSNGFSFRLTKSLPTVPDPCEPLESADGTTMVFRMKQEVRSSFTVERILQLCTCLRKLRHIEILDHVITISDSTEKRVITIDGQRYVFERIEHRFEIKDEVALKNRSSNGKAIDPHQIIVCYIPDRIRNQEMFLYSGLPIEIVSNVPLIIDAPFELTTSRENILHNEWNDIIREELYAAILDVMIKKQDTGLEVLRYVGFRSQNNVITWKNFSDDYLNVFNWRESLRNAKILPILGSTAHVSANQTRCILIPEFIARLQNREGMEKYFSGSIIDTVGKNQYTPLLEAIGCEKIQGAEILRFLQLKLATYIYDQEFREGLYAYLSNNQGNTVFEGIGESVLSLPVFPVKTTSDTAFIPFNQNIYTHKTEVSRDDCYILDTSVMTLKQADDILARKGRINELTQDVFDAKYQRNLKEYIENKHNQHTKAQIAEYVLKEFHKNRVAFSKCKYMLIGLMPQIPFRMANGKIKNGKKFLNTRNQWYVGDLLRMMVVDEHYRELASFLDCTEVETMHFDDIDFAIDDIYDDDIEDLQCDFVNFYEIIKNLIENGLISDEQIAKYHLEFGLTGSDDDDDLYEEFPERPIRDLTRLRKHIQETWRSRPNPYTEKQYIIWKPQFPIDKTNYTLSMYQSKSYQNRCFCQMCKRLKPYCYIERNEIERNPAYAWEQMYLNLCLNCSKDYKLLRNNKVIWQQFLSKIMKINPMTDGSFEVPIGSSSKSITFTATHLAEVQEIFKNEGWGANAPKRKPILGQSERDEGDDDS